MAVAWKDDRSDVEVGQLEKGDYIDAEHLEMILGEEEGSDPYRLAVLTYKQELERELRAIGRPMTIVGETEGLRLLTDSEAASYNERVGEQFFHRARRAHTRNQDVDSNNLSTEENKQHLRTLQVHGSIHAAISQIRRGLKPQAVRRMTPGLPA